VNPNNVFLIAGPLGSGKTTVAEIIERRYNGSTTHFELSEYVRNKYYAEVGGESVSDSDSTNGSNRGASEVSSDSDNSFGAWAEDKKADFLGHFGRELADHIATAESDTDAIIVSGIRSPEECWAFEAQFDTVTRAAVWTSPDLRFERKYGDMPTDTHPRWENFCERNERELDEWGCKQFYANESAERADYIIPNNGNMGHLKRIVGKMLAGKHVDYPFPHDDVETVRQYL